MAPAVKRCCAANGWGTARTSGDFAVTQDVRKEFRVAAVAYGAMVAVLLLCIAVFAINAGFHLLAILGGLQRLSGSSATALFACVLVGFGAAVLTHPKSESNGGHANLALLHCLKPLKRPVRTVYVVLLVYSLVAGIASAPSKPDGGDIPLADLLQAPYFFTAFMLCFSTCALVASHSAVLIYNNPFGIDEP
ncbi:MAG TPA: hypothetical protein VFU02_08015 [Polyangiaceae bacterium]|nr:hypothetical protein [Polyangiaceae bacterium]